MALTRPCLLPVLMFVGVLASVALAQQGKIAVIGTVPCSTATATVAAKSLPAFPNATVQVQCGSSVIASTTTNSNGAFAMLLSEQTSTVSDLLSSCKLVIPTPVSTCDASLRATENLKSPLQLLSGTDLDGLLGNKSLLGDIFGKGGLLGGILGGGGLLGGILGPSKFTVAGN
ncbi:phylloplanin-like [Musa acuminata AAA Group]|uniref:phylloplanin-like n=1 Tax=Musa acuminata AAA Group TaxID=214697 RepID=UPI0031CDE775